VATRSRNPSHFCNHHCRIFQIKQNPLSPTHIEGRIFEGAAVGIADLELQRHIQFPCSVSGLYYDRFRGVNAIHHSCFTDPLSDPGRFASKPV
jgi:hypothetical protein